MVKTCSSNVRLVKQNEIMKAVEVGEVKFKKCTLNNVIYMPELTKNLLSVNAITKNSG